MRIALCNFTLSVAVLIGLGLCSAASAQYSLSTIIPTGLNSIAGSNQAVTVDKFGNVYVADSGNNRVLKESRLSNGTYSQTTIGSGLSFPDSVAVDGSGNVYIADAGNLRVVKETPSGFAGYVQSVFYSIPTTNYAHSAVFVPYSLAVDASGNVYLGVLNTLYQSYDDWYGQVAKLTPQAGGSPTVTVIANRFMLWPYSLAVDGSENLYIADSGTSNAVLKETPSASGYTESVVFSGFSYPNQSMGPFAVASDWTGNLYILAYQWTQSGG